MDLRAVVEHERDPGRVRTDLGVDEPVAGGFDESNTGGYGDGVRRGRGVERPQSAAYGGPVVLFPAGNASGDSALNRTPAAGEPCLKERQPALPVLPLDTGADPAAPL
jgi:hypothetical protein